MLCHYHVRVWGWNMIHSRHDNILFSVLLSQKQCGGAKWLLCLPFWWWMKQRMKRKEEKYWIKHIFRREDRMSLTLGSLSHHLIVALSRNRKIKIQTMMLCSWLLFSGGRWGCFLNGEWYIALLNSTGGRRWWTWWENFLDRTIQVWRKEGFFC